MIAGGNILTDIAAFLEMAAQDPCSALNSMSSAYPAEPLVVAAMLHQLAPTSSRQFAPAPSCRIQLQFFTGADRWAQSYACLPQDATDEVIEMAQDSRFDA